MSDTTTTNPAILAVSDTDKIDLSDIRTGNQLSEKRGFKWLVPTFYILFLMLPIYWLINICLLYTSPSPRDQRGSRMPSSA